MVPGERKLGTPVNLLLVPLGHGKNSCLSCIPVICEWVPACCHVTQCLFPLYKTLPSISGPAETTSQAKPGLL